MRERGGFIRPEWWDRRAREGSIRALEAGASTARGRERILTTEKVIHDFSADQRGSISPILLATLPAAATLILFLGVACDQVIGSPQETPTSPAATSAPIARLTETPTPNATATAEAPKPSPTPEKKAENSIPYYSSCSGELLDPKTGRTVGLMVLTSLPPSPKTKNVDAIAFFYSGRDEQRNQVNEQQYVVYVKDINDNSVQGNRGFWDVTTTLDSTTKQLTGNIEGPPGDYNFRGQCNGSGKAVFTDTLSTIINKQRYDGKGSQSKIDQDVQKVLKEFDSSGVDWQKWPS